jgi:hypothetical protein
MPDRKGWRLVEPEDDVVFEKVCLDLFNVYKRPRIEPARFGRNGQAQHGVDFVLELADGPHGYQCKRTRTLSYAEVSAELEKTRRFRPALRTFTLLTTASRDARVQEKVYTLNERRRREGKFAVGLLYWDDIRDRLAEFPEVLRAHFPDLAPDLDDLLQGERTQARSRLPGEHRLVRAGAELDEHHGESRPRRHPLCHDPSTVRK